MNRQEHLLTILGEECNEVAQRVSKALRFGLQEVQVDQQLSNRERIRRELLDVQAMCKMLLDDGIDLAPRPGDGILIAQKVAQVERWLEFSAEHGTLEPAAASADSRA